MPISRSRRQAGTALAATAALVASGLTLLAAPAVADTVAQPLPFSQSWSDPALITANDSWGGVPGIVGYRGDGLVAAADANPQTVTADGSTTPVSVLAQSTATSTTGGIHEIEASQTVAFQGSGTADAPHLVARVSTTGGSGISVSYLLRDLDGDNGGAQQVALQYRTGGSGGYTNVPAGFVADASGALGDTFPVSAVLPAAADGQSIVDVRILTTDTAGADSMTGVDDLRIVSGGTPPPPPPPAPVADCTAPASALTAISAVQGPGATSPLVGSQVQVEGVVVGDLDNLEAQGFFLQSEAADADPATSEGLFVSSPATATVNLGDRVRVLGTVGEPFGVTTLAASDTDLCASGAAMPPAGLLALPSDDATRERLEGMRVTTSAPLTVTEHFNLDRFGELVLSSSGAQVQPTEIARPGSATATATITANRLNRITLDDGRGAQNVLPVPYLTRTDPVRIGDRVAALEEVVLTFGFGSWRLQPADGDVRDADATTFAPTNPRPASPEPVGGTYQVGAFNVLNYFTTLTTQNPAARGATNAADFAEQEAKIVTAINALGVDVVALQEIENSAALGEATDEALAALVTALNAADPDPGPWAFVPSSTDLPAASSQDVITNAIIYKPARVSPVGRSRSLTDETNFDNAREPVAQTFSANGDVFTVIGNHLKSKGGTGTGANADTGQGNFNADRVGQAEAVLTFAEQLRSETGDSDVLVLGDLNAYTQEDPVDVLRRGGFRDLVETEKPGDYSYVFDGLSGSLDHAMASIPLSQKVTGVDVWNINSPEPDAYQYNGVPALYTADQYRSSDHDPVVVGLDLGVRTLTPYDVQVLGINDFHGRLEPPSAEDSRSVPPRPSVGGAAFLASAVNTFRDELRNTTFVSAGDNIGASPFASAVAQDAPAIAALDAMGLEVTSVGNHEFDRGYADLAGRVANLAGFPFLGANVVGEAPELPTTHTVTLPDGVRVGTIGVTTEQTGTLVSPDGIRGITFADIVASANAAADRLTDGNAANGEADVLVLMAHEGPSTRATTPAECQAVYDRQDAFGAIARGVTPKVDAIIAGHTHQVVNCQLPNPGSKSVEDLRPVMEAGEYGQNLDRLRFTWNPVAETLSNLRTEIVPIRSRSSNPNPASGFAPDPVVQRIVADAVAAARVLGRPVIGRITADIKRAFTPAGTEDRGAESVLGNFVADVQLSAVNQPDQPGAQIAFMNPGGLRTDLLVNRLYGVEQPGEITFGEAAEVQPFANTLFTLSLTGAQVKQVLEQQYQPAGASRPFLALGVSKGLFFLTDGTAPAGSRMSGITLNGAPLDPAATYRIVTNSFLASGGDNFPALAGGTNRVDTGLDDLRAMVEFFGRSSPVTADTAPRRAVGSAPTPVKPGALTVADVSAVEGSTGPSVAEVVIRLDAARTEPVTVAYRTSDVSARAVLDYTPASSTVTIAAGQTSATVTVGLRPDLTDEPDETFTVTLSGSSGPALPTRPAVVTIVDDDAAASTAPVTVFGLADKNTLVRFASDQPGRVHRVGKVRGLDRRAELVGIDFRPADGRLYALTRSGGLYTVDLRTAEATLVRRLTIALDGRSFGVDVNPAADALRIVSDTGQNLRQPFAAGAPTTADAVLNVKGATARGVTGAAYGGNDADAATGTTLYDLDTALDALVVQDPPNSGTLVNAGALGVDAGTVAGFDITSGLTNGRAVSDRAFAALVVGGQAGLYEVSLATGAVTSRGRFSGQGTKTVSDLAVPTRP